MHAHSGPVKCTIDYGKFNWLSAKKNCIEISVVVSEILTIFWGSVKKFRKKCKKKISNLEIWGQNFFFEKNGPGPFRTLTGNPESLQSVQLGSYP